MPSNFPELEKVWKIEVTSGKMVIFIRGILLNQRCFFFFKAPTSALQVIFYRFGQILFNLARILQCIVKKALFLCFLRSVLIAYLITWGLEKNIYLILFLLLFLYSFYFRYEPRALLDSRAVSIELKEYVLKS